MKNGTAQLVVLLSFMATTVACAQRERLLVAQKGERSLGVVDPVTGMVTVSIPENGITGHEVASSPDGRLAYVPIYGDSGVGRPEVTGRTWRLSMCRRRGWWAEWISNTASGRTTLSWGPKMGCST